MVNANTVKLQNRLQAIYHDNPFVVLLEMKIIAMDAGRVTMSMPIILGKHTNMHQIAHGGAIASLADTAMGIACGTIDQKVVTVDMNINLVRRANPGGLIYAHSKVIYQGKQTLVVEAEIVDEKEELLAKSRGTFFVVGHFLEGSYIDENDQNRDS